MDVVEMNNCNESTIIPTENMEIILVEDDLHLNPQTFINPQILKLPESPPPLTISENVLEKSNNLEGLNVEKTHTLLESLNATHESALECTKTNAYDHGEKIIDKLDNVTSKDDILYEKHEHIENSNESDIDVYIIEDKKDSEIKCNKPISSLTAIAIEYDSSDTEVEDTTPTNNDKSSKNVQNQIFNDNLYRTNTKESSNEESDSDDSSDSSSDLSESTTSDSNSDSDSDDADLKCDNKTLKTNNRVKKVKDELDDLPPIEELKISVPEVLCDPLGEVAWMVEQFVVVRPKIGKPTLNLDTVLFIDKGKRTLGKIFDVFGQVSEPHYCVRFNNSEHIKESDIKIGMTVYYCPNTEYTSLVFLHELAKMKATDENGDEETPEFSDDEEEIKYYEALKQKQANEKMNQISNIPQKRRRVSSSKSNWRLNNPWNRNTKLQECNSKTTFHNKEDAQKSDTQHLWSSYSRPVNSCWVPNWRHSHPMSSRHSGFIPYSHTFQSDQYNYQDSNNSNQYFNNLSYNNPGGNATALPPNNRMPCTNNFHSGSVFSQNLPTSHLRFPPVNSSWQTPSFQTPWPFVPLISPPPPPPPPPSSLSPSLENTK